MRSRSYIICVVGFVLFSIKNFLIAADEMHLDETSIQNFQENILGEIDSISIRIEQSIYKNESHLELLELYNARGLKYFYSGFCEDAIHDFNQVLKTGGYSKTIESPVIALALWGRLLCYAHQDRETEALDDLEQFLSYFLDYLPCMNSEASGTTSAYSDSNFSTTENRSQKENVRDKLSFISYSPLNNKKNHQYHILPVAKFADPNERLSPSECKQRVKGTADVMRLLAAGVKKASLVAAINYAISQLEDALNNCCNRDHWTDCLTPIIDAYNYIRKCLDQGVAIAPKIIWQGR